MAKDTCCEDMRWEPMAELGQAAGADFDIGRCASCGVWLMNVFYVSSSTITMLDEAEARRFLDLKDRPGLQRALKAWFN